MMDSSLICLVMNLTLSSQMVSPDSQDVTFKMFHSFCIFYDIVLLIVIVFPELHALMSSSISY